MKRIATIMALAALLVCLPVGRADEFVVPEDDLPSARIGDREVAFTRNGAAVVGNDGDWLFDTGLRYAMSGWKEWGTQIRRSAHGDEWKSEGDDLVFQGTLHDFNRNKRFTFRQRVSLIPGGLRFDYSISAVEKRKVRELGVAMHLPIVGSRGGRSSFWPGFRGVQFPAEKGRAVMLKNRARAVRVRLPDGQRADLVFRDRVRWRTLDDRRWQLNTYRLQAISPGAARRLQKGEPVELSYDLLLGKQARTSVPVGKSRAEIDPYARFAVLSEEGEKMMEGGLLRNPGSPTWLFEKTRPRADGEPGEDDRTTTRTLIWEAGKTKTRCTSRLSGGDGSCRLRMKVQRLSGPWPPEQMRLGFAIPADKVASVETVEPDPSSASSGEQAEKEDPLRRAAIRLKDGTIIRLAGRGQWKLTKARMGRIGCRLVSASPTSETEELLTWDIQVTTSTGEIAEDRE